MRIEIGLSREAFMAKYSEDNACYDHLSGLRWALGIVCKNVAIQVLFGREAL